MLAFCEKQRDLRKFRCPWFEISLPVPINFVARGFIQRRPWFIITTAVVYHADGHRNSSFSPRLAD